MTALFAIFDADLGMFDALVLVAFVLFVVAAVLSLLEKPHVVTFIALGLASFTLGQLFLTP